MRMLTLATLMNTAATAALTTYVVTANFRPFPHIHTTYYRSVVKVLSPADPDRGGTGFAIITDAKNSYVITNAHVCLGNTNGKMALSSKFLNDEGVDFAPVDIVEVSRKADLCLLTSVKELAPLHIAEEVNEGEYITAYGYPGLRTLTPATGIALDTEQADLIWPDPTDPCDGETFSVEPVPTPFGIAMACVRTLKARLTTIMITHGSSGSPALNADGQVVGVMFAFSKTSQVSDMVLLEELKEFLDGK